MNSTTLDHLVAKAMGKSAVPVDRAALEAYQLARLQQTLAYCRDKAPFYQKSLSHVADISDLKALGDLPFTYEDDLRNHAQEMLCVSQDAVARIITMHSSGTTGPAKRLFFSEQDLQATLDFFYIGMQNLVKPGWKVAILLPGATPDSTGHLLACALERMDVSSQIIGLIDNPQLAAEQLAVLQPDTLVGFPVQILAIAQMAALEDIALKSVQTVLLCSDYVAESLCTHLYKLLPCEIFTHYGTVETGLGGGVDCQAHCGTHLRENDLLFEIIEPNSGRVLAPGLWGEIVFTTLNRTAMPLIRYRTGDLGRLLPETCPCGSALLRLDKVRGRIGHILRLSSGDTLSMSALDEQLFSIAGLLDFQASLIMRQQQEHLQLQLSVIAGCEQSVLTKASTAMQQLSSSGASFSYSLTTQSTARIQRGKRILEDKREEIHP